jgi:tetratricopeptide (TPR) repeat protein
MEIGRELKSGGTPALLRLRYRALDYYGLMPRITHFFSVCTLALALSGQAQEAPSDGPTTPPPSSALNAELFRLILLSELSLQNEDMGSAYGLMLKAAREVQDPALFERAIDIALRGRDANAALAAAKAWQQANPSSPDADRYLLQLFIGLNRLPEALAPLQRSLARASASERGSVIVFVSRLLSRASDKAGAADLLEKALTKDLTSTSTGPVAWAMVGNLRLLADGKSSALAAAQKGAALDPLSDEVALLCVNLLDTNFELAQELLLPYLAAKPQPDIHMGFIRKLLDLQRYPQALVQVTALSSAQPEFPDAWLVKGSIEFQNQALAASQASLEKYLTLSPAAAQPAEEGAEPLTPRGAVQAYLVLAQIAQKNNDPKQAQAYLERINSPQDAPRVQLRSAMILAQQGQMAQARALLHALPGKTPEEARNKITAELQLLRDNHQEQAAYDLLTQALQKSPADAELSYELAISAEKLGRPDEMETVLRRLISSKPDYHAAYNALGYSLAERNKRLPEARELVETALKLSPDDPFIIDSLAWVEFRSGNLDQSLALLQKAFASRPDAEIAAHLGEVLWALNQRDQAISAWNQGLQLNRDNDTLKATILRLRGAL